MLLASAFVFAACTDANDSATTTADNAETTEAVADTTAPDETASADDNAADDTAAGDTTAPDSGASGDTAAAATGEPIKVGAILDVTGPLAGYGGAMLNASTLAIDEINAAGGVLGRPLELVDKDAQSDNAQYTLLANELAGDPDIAVVQGGITSASREAIRPIFHEDQKLYFYNVLYEGGVCDLNTFVTGETPSQQLRPLLEWAVENGKKNWYVLAANYNFGQISSSWAETLAAEYGATIVGGPTYFDLTVENFTDQIPKIQASKADLIVSFLVGPSHLNFYKQWASSGLNESTVIVSTTFGFGEEQVALGADSAGILTAFPYFPELDTPASAEFRDLWASSGFSGTVTPGVISTWNGWHLWAQAANAAGSVDRDAVIAQLEEGVTYDGPAGKVTMEGGSHHAILPMRLWEADGAGGFTLDAELTEAAQPTFEVDKCDLVAAPDTDEQFTP